MKLTYRQLEAILAAYLGVHPDKVSTFRSRMKQLQRLEFPHGVNIGRGVRMTYTAEHLLQLAVAFEVLGTGLAAKAATDLVSSHWPKFQAAIGRASKRLAYGSDFETFVQISGQGPTEGQGVLDRSVCVHDLKSFTNQVLRNPDPISGKRAGHLLIRIDYLLSRITRLASDVGQVHDARWTREYSQWSEERDQNQQIWDRADGGAPVPF